MKQRIGVAGAGTMGAGIAQTAAQAGYLVIVFDIDQGSLGRGRAMVAQSLASLVAKGHLSAEESSEVAGRIGWSTEVDALRSAEIVIEAVIEDPQVKRSLFAAIEKTVADHCIVATNTSSLSVSKLAQDLRLPIRFAGLHFFNPVPAMRLVEVVAGTSTDPAVIDQLSDLVRDWGKVAVTARDVPGFIVNRVARPYYGEGFRALGEAAAEASTIDAALEGSGGFRMGPLALGDLIGQDINYAVASSIFEAYGGQTRFRPETAQASLVELGYFGRKSGLGVYDYSAPRPRPANQDPAIEIAGIGVSNDPGLADLLIRAIPPNVPLEVRDDLPAGALSIDGTLILMTDGRTAAKRAEAVGRPVVLFDLCRDFGASSNLVFAASPDSSDQDVARASSLTRLTGKAALVIKDRPGMLVLRTWFQLANAAADALADQVADREGIDQAMQYGTNYPEGPLALAARIGPAFVSHALAYIALETGDSSYSPSPAIAGL
jgi:3-hydroxybutyryl-CoA dehydrogenase